MMIVIGIAKEISGKTHMILTDRFDSFFKSTSFNDIIKLIRVRYENHLSV